MCTTRNRKDASLRKRGDDGGLDSENGIAFRENEGTDAFLTFSKTIFDHLFFVIEAIKSL